VAAGCRVVLSAEMNLGQLTHEVRLALAGTTVPVVPYYKVSGEAIVPEELLAALEELQPCRG